MEYELHRQLTNKLKVCYKSMLFHAAGRDNSEIRRELLSNGRIKFRLLMDMIKCFLAPVPLMTTLCYYLYS